jgi:hypothetical protein
MFMTVGARENTHEFYEVELPWIAGLDSGDLGWIFLGSSDSSNASTFTITYRSHAPFYMVFCSRN